MRNNDKVTTNFMFGSEFPRTHDKKQTHTQSVY